MASVRADEDPAARARAGHVSGMAYLFGAYLLYAAGDAAAKWLVGIVSVWEVLFLRSWIGLLLCALFGGRAALAALRAVPTKRELIGMNLANFCGWAAYYAAAVHLPLPQLYTTYYLSPIIAALLAGPMLGERIRASSWLAAALGFAGVLITTTTTPGQMQLPQLVPTLLGVGAALMWALASVLYRRHVHHSSNLEIVVFNNLAIGVLSALPLAAGPWTAPGAGTGPVFLVLAAAGLGAHFLYISGVRRVAVAVAGPIAFFSLIWSALLAYLIWGDLPRPSLLLGGSLILAAGLLVFTEGWRRSRGAAR